MTRNRPNQRLKFPKLWTQGAYRMTKNVTPSHHCCFYGICMLFKCFTPLIVLVGCSCIACNKIVALPRPKRF